jgi:hypothetical protein
MVDIAAQNGAADLVTDESAQDTLYYEAEHDSHIWLRFTAHVTRNQIRVYTHLAAKRPPEGLETEAEIAKAQEDQEHTIFDYAKNFIVDGSLRIEGGEVVAGPEAIQAVDLDDLTYTSEIFYNNAIWESIKGMRTLGNPKGAN